MRNTLILMAMIALVLAVEGCTITQKFGPFYGKVVDAETGDPIQGAVVAVWFQTESGTFGGTVYSVADAVETLTDANGEFRIPPHRINLFRMMASWDDECQVSIFKPGYGAYPGNLKTYCSWKDKHPFFIPEKEYVTYYLPKLVTFDEIRQNYILRPGIIGVEKLPMLRKLMDERWKVKDLMEKN